MEEQRKENRGAKDTNSGIEPKKGDTGTVDRQGTEDVGQG
jgi:hypothetical protein